MRSLKQTRAACVALLALVCAACSNIRGDIDLSPFYRSFHHPGIGSTETDVMGDLVSHVTDGTRTKLAIRPFYVAETRPWACGAAGETERVVSVLPPLAKYYKNPRTTKLRISPFYFSTEETTGEGGFDKDVIFFPLVFYGSSTPPPNALAAGERPDSYFALFPLGGQINSFAGFDRFQFIVWPLLQRVTKRVFTTADEEEQFTSILGLGGWTTGPPRGGSWRVLPFYGQSLWTYPPHRAARYPEGADPSQPLPRYVKRTYLWPFVHHHRLNLDRGPGKETVMWSVWPFFKHEKSYDHEFWTILWPLFRYNVEQPEARAGVAAEDPAGAGEAEARPNVLVHFLTQLIYKYERTSEYRRRRFGLLLYSDYTSLPEDRRNRIDSRAFLWPIGYWNRSAVELDETGGYRDDSHFALVPVFQTHKRTYLSGDGTEDGRTDRFTRIWPLFSYESNADGSRDIHAIPILPLRIERFVGDAMDGLGVLFHLYRYQRSPDALGGVTRHSAILGLVRAYYDDTESTLSIPLLYTGRTLREGDTTRFSRNFLGGLVGWEGEDAPGGRSTRALRLFWFPINLR